MWEPRSAATSRALAAAERSTSNATASWHSRAQARRRFMISIITAVYNQLAVNRLFVENLRRYTHHPYELIIIDNGSTDGSAEFFEQQGATVIRNGANYSYPHCQNQGIK